MQPEREKIDLQECDVAKITEKLKLAQDQADTLRAKCVALHCSGEPEAEAKEPAPGDIATLIIGALQRINTDLNQALEAITAFGG
jgi:hypothetical protein